MSRRSVSVRALGAFGLLLLPALVPSARAAEGEGGECAPPHTLVALLPLADQTDRAWELWSGANPAELVARLLADSLELACGRRVLRVPFPTGPPSGAPRSRAVDDEQALSAARHENAEVVVTGTVSAFSHDDTRGPARFSRWGFGAPDARSRARVSVTLRVLDVRSGAVIIECSAARERAGRGTANAMAPGDGDPFAGDDPLMGDLLGEVLADLLSTLEERLDASWQARVLAAGRDRYELDAGTARGLFTGERLDVWRSGIQLFDEDLVHLADATRIGALVVTELEGRGRARARLLEGDARSGDTVRPCAGGVGPAMSLRH